MLILTRKPGESVYIGDDIKITIVELKGHQIRVGIDAPKSYRIYREEIYVQILEENRKAAEAAMVPGVESLEGLTAAFTGGSQGNEGGDDSTKKPRSVDLKGGFFSVSTAKKEKGPDVVIRKKRGDT